MKQADMTIEVTRLQVEQFNHAALTAMRQQWYSAAAQWRADSSAIDETWQLLLTSYSRSERHYHGLQHIHQLLTLAQQYQAHINGWPSFYFAIWFHDLIQQAGADSEGLSAELAREYLQRLQVPEQVIQGCEQLILATRHHHYQADTDVQLFVDLDLSILAVDRPRYQSYAHQCRQEYYVPDFVYRCGRKRFLRQLLARDAIFSSEIFHQYFEQSARNNLQWELDEWLSR
mgnify:CR=1 FL=1